MKWLSLLLALLICAACASSGDVSLVNQNYSISDLKKAVISAVGEPRIVSENQRTVLSQYFGRKTDKNFDPKRSPCDTGLKILLLSSTL